MSDVRDEMVRIMRATKPGMFSAVPVELADAILERFEVTPKPVITDKVLGAMAVTAANWPSLDMSCPAAREKSMTRVGAELRDALEVAGLKIVRKDE